MKNTFLGITIAALVGVGWGYGGANAAEDAPAANADTEVVDLTALVEDSETVKAWRKFAESIGLECDDTDLGLGICIDGDRIYSADERIVETPMGNRGWVESRQAAARLAELQAKQRIIAFIEQGITAQQNAEKVESFIAEVGDSEEILTEERDQWDEISARVEMIVRKGADLAEAELDRRITEADPFYDTKQYKELPRKQRLAVFKSREQEKITAFAEELLRGAVPVFSHESVDAEAGKSRVLVAVAWTPRTRRFAESVGSGDYNATVLNPEGKKGSPAKSMIPTDKDSLLGAFGTRMYLDENGEHYILAYAQAEARRSQSRQEQAIKTAQEAAELRARGMIARFVSEFIEVAQSQDSGESIREFSDQSNWRENRREYNSRIAARTKTVRLRGLRPVKIWKTNHPATDQIVVGAVVKWSPASSQQAAEIRRLASPKNEEEVKMVDSQSDKKNDQKKAIKAYASKPVIIDLDAY